MKNDTMIQSQTYDVAIVGGGLAGLAAAVIVARAGRSVLLLEQGPQLGGRAGTREVEGFHFNQGPHALYRGGEGAAVLRELGVSYGGGPATPEGSWVLRNGGAFPTLRTPEAVLASAFLSDEAKAELLGLFAMLAGDLQTERWDSVTLQEWMQTHIRHDAVRSFFAGMFRLATYCNDPLQQSAGATLAQSIVGQAGVDYIDGGWKSLVDGLRDAALKAGVRIETRSAVKAIECNASGAVIHLASGDNRAARVAIVTASPATTARLVNGGAIGSLHAAAEHAVPVHAACLDVALTSLPHPEHQFAIGLDQPLYYSVHTRSARLGPEGGIVIHLAKYLSSTDNDSAGADALELEALMDRLQPGWRDVLVSKQFLPRMLVTNAVVTAAQGGTRGRPGPAIPELKNLFIAGDWVGSHGMLADASLASAREAATLALEQLVLAQPESAQQGEVAVVA